jgi:hypothetical protein
MGPADAKSMSAAQFLETLRGDLSEFFMDEDQLRALWRAPDTRLTIFEGLADMGLGEEPLAEKLTPLLRLRYNNAIADAVADLGSADQIRRVFVGFQK